MQRNDILLLVGVAMAPLATLSAQDVPAQAVDHRVGAAVAIQQSVGTADVPGGVVAGGRHYEATLLDGSMTFVPVFGDRAPRALPLQFTLQSIRRGNAVVFDVANGAQPKPQRSDAAVWFDRGAGIVERYDVRAEGLEQTFTFATPLPGSGDIVVRGRVATELQGQVAADGGVLYRMPGVGGVSFGTVTGIDANGARGAGSLRLDGDALELVLPASFVDTAAWPLVLDPLVGVQFETNGAGATQDDSESDVAYDTTNDNYLVVWKRKFGVGYSLIRGQRLDAAGAAIGSTIFFVPSGTRVQSRPRVANVNLRDRYLVVWQESASPVGPRDIWGTTVDAATGAQSGVVALVATAGDDFNPCAGSEATTADDEALLAWEDSAGINAQQVTLPAAGDPVAAGAIATVGTLLSADPFLSKSGGTTGRYVLGWTAINLLSDSEMVLQGIDRNAVLIGSAVTLTSNTVADIAGAVDGNGSSFVAVWQREEAAGTGVYDIRCRGVSVSTTALTLTGSETSVLPASGNDANPDICYLGSKYGVFWVHEFSSFVDDVYGTILNGDCTTCGSQFFLAGINNPGGYNTEFEARCVGQYAGGSSSDQGLLVFSEAQNAPPFASDVVGQRFEAIGPGLAPVVVGPGCGAGGSAGLNGPFAVGNSGFQFTLTGAQPTAVLFLSLAFPGAPLACGACGLTNPVAFDFKVNVGGNASSNFAVPCNPVFVGTTLEFQWVSFFTTTSPCPAVTGLAASQRIRVTVAP